MSPERFVKGESERTNGKKNKGLDAEQKLSTKVFYTI